MIAARLLVVVLLVALLAPAAIAQDPQPADAATLAALQARGAAFRDAWAAADGAALWTLIAPASRKAIEADLAELRTRLGSVPDDRRDEAVPGLGATVRELLAINDGQAWLTWLLQRVPAATREIGKKVTVAKASLSGEGSNQRADLGWSGPDADSQLIADEMPVSAVRDGDSWVFVIDLR